MNVEQDPLPFQRPLTASEQALVRSIFKDAVRLDEVRIFKKKWWFFQPKAITMAPQGAIHFHPQSPAYCMCFAHSDINLQAHFIHEMVHIWQHQQGINLLLQRHPFFRYSYKICPQLAFKHYGIEQQAEMVRHVFLMRNSYHVRGAASLEVLENLLPF